VDQRVERAQDCKGKDDATVDREERNSRSTITAKPKLRKSEIVDSLNSILDSSISRLNAVADVATLYGILNACRKGFSMPEESVRKDYRGFFGYRRWTGICNTVNLLDKLEFSPEYKP